MPNMPYERALHAARQQAEQEWLDMLDRSKSMAHSNDFRNSELRDDFIDTQTEAQANGRSHEEFVSRRVEDLMIEYGH